MSEDFKDIIQEMMPPFGKLLEVKVTRATKDVVSAEFTVRADMCTLGHIMHGGAIMAIADNLGGAGTALNMPRGARTNTVESKTNFLAPIPEGETGTAEATPVHVGGLLQVWQTRIMRADGKLAAVVTQTQLVRKGD